MAYRRANNSKPQNCWKERVEEVKTAALRELEAKIKEHKANYQSLKKYAQEQEALVKQRIKQVEEQKEVESSSEQQQIEQLKQEFNQELEQLKQQLSDRETTQKKYGKESS